MSDTPEIKKLRAKKVVAKLDKEFPSPECALVHRNPYELTVATILSAQCTDARVNMVTPALFEEFPTPQRLAVADLSRVEELIQSTGFFRAKANNIVGMAQKLVSDFNGELPRTIDELTTLPGVGRKTANVVLGVAFGIASGIVVDTHVKRITNLLGLTTSQNPEIIERELMMLLPKPAWIAFSHQIILHGRKTCIARRPKCVECPLLKLCPRVGLPLLKS
ncbi:endonuclease III [Planctomicrobium sp. SH668]|uniref:endonuclease III n=1 Tax=Planctomicrobium sp. SH668 TaxID=3448126 RepID=UPI003F5AFEDB